MRELRTGVLLNLLVVLLVAGTVRADDVVIVTYDDTQTNYRPPRRSDPDSSFIRNGDFLTWTNGYPDHWTVWAESKEGWTEVHLAQVDMARRANPEGLNNALGFFIQHAGGTGSYYAGAYQQLIDIPAAGYYVVNVSQTAWYDDSRATSDHNSGSWYAISSFSDPASVTDWRELTESSTPCPNSLRRCSYWGRNETVWIEPGQYFHLRAGHNFPVFFASTVFVIDDIHILPVDETIAASPGFYQVTQPDGDPTEVRWDRQIPR